MKHVCKTINNDYDDASQAKEDMKPFSSLPPPDDEDIDEVNWLFSIDVSHTVFIIEDKVYTSCKWKCKTKAYLHCFVSYNLWRAKYFDLSNIWLVKIVDIFAHLLNLSNGANWHLEE